MSYGYNSRFHKDHILSSTRVHIERRAKYGCDGFDAYEGFEDSAFDLDHKDGQSGFKHHDDEKCNCECGFNIDKGFDAKRDRLTIDVMVDCKLDEQTFYTLILAQPAPCDAGNLPVIVKVHYCDTKKIETIRMIRAYEPWGAVGDLEYGQDLPKCRNRIPLYFTNGREFVDLRKRCCDL